MALYQSDGLRISTYANGDTPYIKDGYWWIGNTNLNVKAEGVDGRDGIDGTSASPVYTIELSNDNATIGTDADGNSWNADLLKLVSTINVSVSEGETDITNNCDFDWTTNGCTLVENGVEGVTQTCKWLTNISADSASVTILVTQINPSKTIGFKTFTITKQKQGVRGIQGPKGDDGTGVAVKASAEDCTEIGDAYIDSDGNLLILTALPNTFTNGGQIKGPPGTSNYLHVAYADDASGTNMSQDPSGKAYIGTYVDEEQNDSQDPSAYKWTKWEGDAAVTYVLSVSPNSWNISDSANIEPVLSVTKYVGDTVSTAPSGEYLIKGIKNNTEYDWPNSTQWPGNKISASTIFKLYIKDKNGNFTIQADSETITANRNGEPAKDLNLLADGYFFVKKKNGTVEPSKINFTTQSSGLTGNYTWNNADSNSSTASSNVLTYRSTDTYPKTVTVSRGGLTDSVTIGYIEEAQDGNTPEIKNGYWYIGDTNLNIKAEGQTPTITNGIWYIGGTSTGVKAQGEDAIGIMLTNPSMTFNSKTSTSETCSAIVMSGTTSASYSSTVPTSGSDWKYTLSGYDSIDSSGVMTINKPNANTVKNITITVYKGATKKKQQTIGIQCTIVDDGLTVKDFNITADSYIFVEDVNGVISGQITFTAVPKNLSNPTYKWNNNSTGSTYTLTATSFGTAKSKTISCSCYENGSTTPFSSDSITIYRVPKGTTGPQGEAALTIGLTNGNMTFNIADTTATEKTSVIAYSGSTQINYTANPTSTGGWQYKIIENSDYITVTTSGNNAGQITVKNPVTAGGNATLSITIEIYYNGSKKTSKALEINCSPVKNGTSSTAEQKYVYKGFAQNAYPKTPPDAPAYKAENDGSGWSITEPNSYYVFRSEQTVIDNKIDSTKWSQPVLIKENGKAVSSERLRFLELTNGGDKLGVFGSNDDGYLTINASYIQTGELNADLITAGTLNADLIKTGTLNADLIKAGTFSIGSGSNLKFRASIDNKEVIVGGWEVTNNTIQKNNLVLYSNGEYFNGAKVVLTAGARGNSASKTYQTDGLENVSSSSDGNYEEYANKIFGFFTGQDLYDNNITDDIIMELEGFDINGQELEVQEVWVYSWDESDDEQPAPRGYFSKSNKGNPSFSYYGDISIIVSSKAVCTKRLDNRYNVELTFQDPIKPGTTDTPVADFFGDENTTRIAFQITFKTKDFYPISLTDQGQLFITEGHLGQKGQLGSWRYDNAKIYEYLRSPGGDIIGGTCFQAPNGDATDYAISVGFKDINYLENGKFRVQNSGYVYMDSPSTTGSDRNLKKDIEPIPSIYSNFFDKLNPVRYKYKSGTSDRYHTGFISQEVYQATIDAGMTSTDNAIVCIENRGQENELWALRYEEIIALNTQQIQFLKPRMTDAEREIIELKSKISILEQELKNLKKF